MVRRLWVWLLAVFRLDPDAVCEVSETMGPFDCHDYRDSVEGEPGRFGFLTCKRCGKQFLSRG